MKIEKIVKPSEEEMATAVYLAALQTIRINSAHQWENTQTTIAAAAVTTMKCIIPPHDDRLYIITHVAASDETTSSKTIELYNMKTNQKHLLTSGVTAAVKDAMVWDGELLTGPSQEIHAIFTTPTSSDVLRFTVSGYWIPQ